MTSETFYQYISNVLYPHLVEKNTKFPVILFLDGYKSHLNYQLSLLCSELQIEIISLYPNTIRILQPCDVAVFRPLKETWRQCVRQWEEEHLDEILNKVMFGPLLEKAINVGVKQNTLFSGFKACGLYPFSPDAIDYSKCLGAKKTPDNLPLNPVEDSQYMDYKTFAEIVGEDTLAILENISINRNTTKSNDQHIKQLFNL
ncbi:DDE superfamily endonuclease [Popillia japonica]|uniref:DDE superfamily endonuclease n=1 Tax=Popillia japonica TaxID=7064 RepID=A0AAW1K2B2_POPJA